MSVPLPAFRRVRLTQQCVIHPQDKGGNYLPCASEDWVLFVSLAADEEKIILRTEHRCLPIEPGSALLLPPNRGSAASAPHNGGQCGRYWRSGRHDQPQLLLPDVQASGGGIASSIPRGHWRTPGYAGLRKRLYGIERLLEKR